MIKIAGILFLCVFSFISKAGESFECEGVSYDLEDVLSIQRLFIDKDMNSIFEISKFPMRVQLFGSESTLRERSFEMDWKYIVSKENIETVKNSNLCGVVEIFNPERDWLGYGSLRITQMIFNGDKEDLKYTFSGFSSVKKLFSFIKKINALIDEKNFLELSKYIEYPVSDENRKKHSSQKSFVKHADSVITEKVKTLLKEAENGSNFIEHAEGIMLNSRGDVWIVPYVDKGILIRINDPYKSN